jgi:osmotically-inducible protein OsmY
MANKRDNRFQERERWRDNPSGPYRGEERQGYGRARYSQYNQRNQPEYYEEGWTPRDDYGRYADERHYGQGYSSYGEQYRDRPYLGSSSYSPGGGYEGQHEPYREGREGYAATGTGTGWGSAEVGRHRLGSLTESAADSAQHVMGQRYGREYPQRVSYAGRGPKGYKRSDERIREDVSEVLMRNHDVDATNIEVTVSDGIVVLAGSVDDRRAKRIAEDITEDVSGVCDVQNQIRVQPASLTANAESKGPAASETSRMQSSGSVLGLSAEAGGRR